MAPLSTGPSARPPEATAKAAGEAGTYCTEPFLVKLGPYSTKQACKSRPRCSASELCSVFITLHHLFGFIFLQFFSGLCGWRLSGSLRDSWGRTSDRTPISTPTTVRIGRLSCASERRTLPPGRSALYYFTSSVSWPLLQEQAFSSLRGLFPRQNSGAQRHCPHIVSSHIFKPAFLKQSDGENVAPVWDAVEFWEGDFVNYFNHTSIYRGPPSLERETAWDSLWRSKSCTHNKI